MNTITLTQLKTIHTLFSKAGLKDKDDKKSIIRTYTKERSESSKDLTFKEAAALIGHLKTFDVKDPKADKMRKKILSLAHEMGYKLESGAIDMNRVNAWTSKYGYLHKPLNSYTYEELPVLVSQFETVYKQFINKL